MAARRRADRRRLGTFLARHPRGILLGEPDRRSPPIAPAALGRLQAAGEGDDGARRGGDAVHGRQRGDPAVDPVPDQRGEPGERVHAGRADGGGRRWRSRRSGSPGSGRRSCSPTRTGASRRATPARPARGPTTRRWAHRARGWTRVMQLDAWFSMVVFTVATVAFYLLGAAVLHPQGLDPKGTEMIPTLSRMYLQPLEGTPLAGLPRLDAGRVPARRLGRPVQDALRRHRRQQPADGRLPRPGRDLAAAGPCSARRGRSGSSACSTRSSRSASITPSASRKALIKVGGIAQGLMLPLIAGATLYLRQRDTDRRVGPSFLTDIFTWLAFFAITAVAVYSVYDLVPADAADGARPASVGEVGSTPDGAERLQHGSTRHRRLPVPTTGRDRRRPDGADRPGGRHHRDPPPAQGPTRRVRRRRAGSWSCSPSSASGSATSSRSSRSSPTTTR